MRRLARYRGDLLAVTERAQQLLVPARIADPARFGLGEDLRGLALIDLGIAELWTARFGEADRHLEQGIAMATAARPTPPAGARWPSAATG